MIPSPRLRRSRRHSPPALVDDAMREIFLRLPLDDLASLVRAAAVCKNWWGILSDADFAGLYREFHGAPPMLGFLHNTCDKETHCVAQFVSTASSFCPPGCRDRSDWFVFDSRHGRVLFCTPKDADDFVVCDPMSANAPWIVPTNADHSAILLYEEDDEEFCLTWNAAVLCSSNGCDHLDCRGGPFLVLLVDSDEAEGATFAAVYSSETGEWSETVSLDEPNVISEAGHSVLLGNKVYFPCERANRIVEYNVGEHELRVIDTPFQSRQHLLINATYPGWQHLVLMAADDDMLLFTGVWGSKLHLCSMEPGAVAWARCRVIELKHLLPPRTLSILSVVGAVEGAGVIFLSTKAGLFRFDLNSGRSKKVDRESFFFKIIPYSSFYTGVHRLLQGH